IGRQVIGTEVGGVTGNEQPVANVKLADPDGFPDSPEIVDGHGIKSPPLTQIVWPVIHVARSFKRKPTTSATSSGDPIRRSGMRFLAWCASSSTVMPRRGVSQRGGARPSSARMRSRTLSAFSGLL